jgi:LPS sulfotransferase NodH
MRFSSTHHLFSHARRLRAPSASNRCNQTIAQTPIWTAPTATYIICTNLRSGSWLLSEGLASTGLAGNPREWFNTLEEQRHRARWRMDHSTDLSFAAYFALAEGKSTTGNGVSGLKLHYYQLAELSKKIAGIEGIPELTDAQLMPKAFPNAKYVWLTRCDKARQAISVQIASSTREWWAIESVALNKPEDNAGDPEFDPKAIARLEAALARDDAKWQSLFHDIRIVPFVITYEDLAADYSRAIRSVLKWLGAPDADAVAVPPPRLKKQSNARNEEWLARYLAFKGEGGHLAPSPAADETGNPKSEAVQRIVGPDAWNQWVGRGKLLKTKDDAIVEVLVNNGYSHRSALAEVQEAASDPYLLSAIQAHQRLGKGAALLNALGQLARLDSRANIVERRSNLSRDEFRDRYYAANRPVIIENMMTDWRAMTAWTPDYLKSVAGDRTVEVMTGRNADPRYELNSAKHRDDMRFADYVDMVYSGTVTNDYYRSPTIGSCEGRKRSRS